MDYWVHWIIEVGEIVTLVLLSCLVVKLLRWTKKKEQEETQMFACCKGKEKKSGRS